MTEMIKCEKLCMNYEGNHVLCNLSFSVNQGDFLSIVGENGSGKSTLVKCLLGILKHKGEIEFNGLKHSQIGYLPQQTPVAEDFPASVEEVVLSGCISGLGFFPFYKEKQKQKASEALTTMRISEIKNRRFRDLSGGQKQRVLIARALCAAEKLLLLDEPVTGLDPVVKTELYEIINQLHKEEGMTVIMISHDLKGALNNTEKILHISEKSEENFFGTVAQYKQTEVFKAMGGLNA